MSSLETNESQLQAALSRVQAMLPTTPTPYEEALLAAVSLLPQELTLVQDRVWQHEQTIDRLLPLARQSAALQRRSSHTPPPPPTQPKTLRPMEYWLAHVPEYGETLTTEELATFQSKPRVRPEDVELTPEDLARQQRRRYSTTPTIEWTTIVILITGLLVLLAMCVLRLR